MSVQAAAPASSAVRFDSVGLAYGGHGPEVLKDVDFTLPAGSFHFLTPLERANRAF